MKIKTVTITGADNKTNIDEMFEISKQYPFVEWGILFSPKRVGTERYPGFTWLHTLWDEWKKHKLNLSAHLCGEYTRQMLMGNSDLYDSLLLKEIFNRFQLNFNSKNTPVTKDFFPILKNMDKNFILQYNQSNVPVCVYAMKELQNVSFLYDSSGGRGNIAKEWKPPFMGFLTGYAGGLSPDKLESELKKIEKVCGDAEIWIDTESRVRTNEILDMEKVKLFLEIASAYVSK